MKILIADDHELFRDGLRHILESLESNTTVIESSDFEQAIHAVESHKDIDLVLLDLGMPGRPWDESLPVIRAALPATVPVVILSGLDDRRKVQDAVDLGAAGFIPKSSSGRVMLSALHLVLSGGVYLPEALLEQDEMPERGMGSAGAAFLTPRQREVLGLLGQGKSNKEIARVLALAEGTVKLHVTAILRGLNVNNRTRAVVAAAQLGLTDAAASRQ